MARHLADPDTPMSCSFVPTLSCRTPAAATRAGAACGPYRRPTAVDADGSPVWDLAVGSTLAPGIAAWERRQVGPRTESWWGWSMARWHLVVVTLARPHQISRPSTRQSLTVTAAALDGEPHPGLPRLIRAGLDAEIPYLVTEWVNGDRLDELAGTAPLDPASATAVARDLLSTAGALHRRGLAHLDIRPGNAVVRNRRTLLIDAGSVRALGDRCDPGPVPGSPGDPAYTAPEAAAGGTVAAAMDVYAIGATLREALTGLSPFDLDPRRRRAATAPLAVAPGEVSVHALAAAMLDPDPAARPSVPAALDAITALSPPTAARPDRSAGGGRRGPHHRLGATG